MKPFYNIMMGLIDVTGGFNSRNVQITVNDCAGFENDRVDFQLHDDPPLFLPPMGTVFGVTLGYEYMPGADFRYNGVSQFCGTFALDQADFSKDEGGSKLTLKAHANFMKNDFKKVKDRDFHDKTLGDIVKQIASETGVQPRIDPDLAKIKVPHIDQANVSNMQFITDLGKRYGATGKVAEGVLYFGKKGKLKALSGAALTPILVFERDCTGYSSPISLRGDYDGVVARYPDLATAEEKTVLAGKDGVTKVLPHRYPTEAEAKAAAEGHNEDLAKETETFSFTCIGNPTILAESPIILVGFRPGIRTSWIADKVTHQISSGGYTTQVECRLPDAEAKSTKVDGRD